MAEFGTGGALAARALRDAGVTHLFTLNGAHIWPLYLGAVEHGIKLVDVRHEQTAAFAAEGWAKLTRQVGVAAVTAGPGVTNALSGIATARGNDSPLLVLAGRAPDARWGQGSLQEMDHLPLVREITKLAETAHDVEAVSALVSRAVAAARGQRTGPAFVDLPLDVAFAAGQGSSATASDGAAGDPPEPGAVTRLAALLAAAERPVLVAGGTVWWSHAEQELLAFAESAQVPVVLNGLARGMLPPDHPLFATRARSKALGEADLVVLVGASLDFRLGFGQAPVFADDVRFAYLDVDEFRKPRAAEVAIYGDLRQALAALAAASEPSPRAEWRAHLREQDERARDRDAQAAAGNARPIHPLRLLAEIQEFCAEDAIIVGDGGDFVSFAGRVIHRSRPGLWMDVGPFGCLGSGPGYAIAAQLANPGRQVLLLSGDGAFGFAGLEVDTFLRHGLPIVTVIGNNGIWALEKHPMQNLLGTSLVSDLRPGTRYDEVVSALGGHGELVESPEEIRPALERAFASGRAACLNVLLDPNVEYPRSAVLM